jgi:VPDSG-CTERM motif
MKSLKYITLIGLLCAGLTSLARADVNFLGTTDTGSSGDADELAAFIALGGDSDALVCAKPESLGTTSTPIGDITIVDNGDDTITVTIEFTGTFEGSNVEICGFAVKDGQGNLGAFYSVTNGQGVGPGTLVFENLLIPGNGSGAFSHLTVFCCPGGNGVPDGGTTVMLLGASLGALGMVRRYLKS